MTLAEYFNTQISMSQNLDFIVRILVACVCGAAIGFERSKRSKVAGIRTHVLVCCAAALVMIISKYGFVDLEGIEGVFFSGTRATDPARIAAQAISGISFLGAGVIFKHGNTIKGLTTAAGIWATAGIGLALGAGMYWIGIFSTVLIALLQITMHRFTVGADASTTTHLVLTVKDAPQFREALFAQLETWKAQVSQHSITRKADGTCVYELTLNLANDLDVDALYHFLDTQPGVIQSSFEQIN